MSETNSAAEQSAAAKAGGAARPAVRRWLIELGGQNLVVLRIAKRDLTHQRRPLTLARQSLTYDFSPRGLQLSAELKLDVLGEPIRQIAIDLDSPLTLVTARYGEAQLVWSEDGADASDDGLPKIALDKLRSALDDLGVAYPTHSRSHRVVLQLPEPLHGSSRVLRIGAVAPLPVSGRLPSIRPASPELIWQEGIATLLVPLPLELSELRTVGCRQTKQELLPAPTRGDAITLQYFRPDADVYIGLRRQSNRLQLQSGTAIDIRGTSIRGRTIAELTAEQGEFFSLSADLSTSWAIDSVESSPAGNIASWTIGPSRGAAQRLTINLAKSLRSDRPLRLMIGGRWWRAPLGETLKSDDLKMLRFRDVPAGRQIVGIHAAAPFRLQLTGSENLNRLNPERLDPIDTALLGSAAAGTLFVADARASALTVGVARETPKYSGAITLMLKADDNSLSESYGFTCTPDATEIDRLLVQFSRPCAEPLIWEIAGAQKSGSEASESIVARKLKLSASARAGLGLAAGEVWELTWRQPRSEPFTILATRTIPLDAPLPVSLASFVQADSQQGFVEVRSVGEHVAEIQNRRLQPATVPSPSSDRWPVGLAAYRYDPQEEAILSANDPLPGLTVGPGKSPPKAWVWSLRADAHYSAHGHGEHVASWRIENMGRSRVSFRMPSESTLHLAWVDGTVMPNASPDEGTGQLRLELPADRRFTTIGLKWASDGKPLSIVSSRSVDLPEIVGLPVLSRRVNVWLPPNYRLMENDAGGQSAGAAVSWSQRLFGPIGRPPNQAPFNPLASDDWTGTVDALALHDRVGLQARRFVDRIASFASASNATTKRKTMTWAELLSRTQLETVEANEPPAPLLIDGQASATLVYCLKLQSR